MKAKEFIIELKKESKPRNFVAKNAKMGGAGQHKDKKRAEKQGDTKHKKSLMPMETALRDKEDYQAKRKALDDLSRNKDVDQKAVQQRRLDLDKEARQKGVEERVRDPEDWDEGNTEPPNNFAVYINGKKWKVFKGRGYHADDYREQAHYQQLKDWAAKKSASTGKKWTVSITGENPTESLELDEISWSGIKKGAAAAGLAGAMALGSGGAHARVTGGEDPGVNRLTGKPNVTQVAPSDSKTDSGPSLSSRYGPDYEGSPAAYTITVKGQDYKFAGRDKDGPGTGPIIKVPGGAVGIRGLSPVAVELGKDGTFYIAPK
jgi:hypothetical protein